MEKHVDVTAADAERRCDVFAGLLFEQTQHHHRLLRLAELVDASAKANVLFGFSDELLGRGRVIERGRKRIQVFVRPGNVMTTALVARRVANDAREEGRPLRSVRRQLVLLGDLQERAEPVLNAFDRILGRGALATGDTDELSAAMTREVAQDSEGIGAFIEHGSHQGLEPLPSYSRTL